MKLSFRKINVVLTGISLLLSIGWMVNILPAARADIPPDVYDQLEPHDQMGWHCVDIIDEWQTCSEEYEANGHQYPFDYERTIGPTTICSGFTQIDADNNTIPYCCTYKCYAHLCVYVYHKGYTDFDFHPVWSGYAAGLQSEDEGLTCEGPSTDGSPRFCVTPTPAAITPQPEVTPTITTMTPEPLPERTRG